MPSELACPICRTVRAPNGRWCHVCGYAYDGGQTIQEAVPSAIVARQQTEHKMSFATAVSIGAGLAVGAILVGIVSTIVGTIVLAGALGAAFRGL